MYVLPSLPSAAFSNFCVELFSFILSPKGFLRLSFPVAVAPAFPLKRSAARADIQPDEDAQGVRHVSDDLLDRLRELSHQCGNGQVLVPSSPLFLSLSRFYGSSCPPPASGSLSGCRLVVRLAKLREFLSRFDACFPLPLFHPYAACQILLYGSELHLQRGPPGVFLPPLPFEEPLPPLDFFPPPDRVHLLLRRLGCSGGSHERD